MRDWNYVKKVGNPELSGVYYVTVIFPRKWDDKKKMERNFVAAVTTKFFDGDEWSEGGFWHERVYAWMDYKLPDICELPEGVEVYYD